MSETRRYKVGRVMVGVAGQTAVALIPDSEGEAVYYTDHASALRQRDERIAELEAKLVLWGNRMCEINKENARLSAPVTDVEWVSRPRGGCETYTRDQLDALLAARKEQGK